MIKKTIKFNDLDGNELVEDFYFNLTKAELADLELSTNGGLGDSLKALVKAEDVGRIIGEFKRILTLSVGRKSDDNRRFIKSQEIVDDFLQSEAYSELFMELIGDSDAAIGFLEGIVPQSLLDDRKASEVVTVPQIAVPAPDAPLAMTREDLEAAINALRNQDPPILK